jgi:hypothetical protein
MAWGTNEDHFKSRSGHQHVVRATPVYEFAPQAIGSFASAMQTLGVGKVLTGRSSCGTKSVLFSGRPIFASQFGSLFGDRFELGTRPCSTGGNIGYHPRCSRRHQGRKDGLSFTLSDEHEVGVARGKVETEQFSPGSFDQLPHRRFAILGRSYESLRIFLSKTSTCNEPCHANLPRDLDHSRQLSYSIFAYCSGRARHIVRHTVRHQVCMQRQSRHSLTGAVGLMLTRTGPDISLIGFVSSLLCRFSNGTRRWSSCA